MLKIILFVVLSIPVIVISWRALFTFKRHGFYRFISWECIIWLFVSNYSYWFVDPFGFEQIISWIFLIYSGYLVIAGVIMFRKMGKQSQKRKDNTLYKFEKTTELIEAGIFKYIRHPLYGSLLFLTLGIFFKNINLELLIVTLFSSFFLFATAFVEEKNNIEFFGEKYIDYMKRTKMFIPFIL